MRRFILLLFVCLGCKKGDTNSSDVKRASDKEFQQKNGLENGDTCSISVRPLRHPEPPRLVAMGDVHGDLAATQEALRLAGAIDEEEKWIGGALVLVQTGDILDRGDDEKKILELFAKLEKQAQAAGGALIRLNGNHEFMNVMGDFRYVTTGGYSDFSGTDVSEAQYQRGRQEAFAPGGEYALRLSAFDMVTIVGESVFVHGGVLPQFVDDLEKSNRDSRCFLSGQRKKPPSAVLDPAGPLWTRAFSKPKERCDLLEESLKRLGVKRMIVGHTPQLTGITSACAEKVWRIDTGMAGYYNGPTEVLEIRSGQVKVLK